MANVIKRRLILAVFHTCKMAGLFALARRLTRIVYAMWRDDKDFARRRRAAVAPAA